MMKLQNAFLASLLVLVSVVITWAQHPNQARGFQANGVFSAVDIDSVNLFNGNLNIAIPIGNTYQTSGGFSYSLRLSYNSTLWRTLEWCSNDVNLNTSLFGTWNEY